MHFQFTLLLQGSAVQQTHRMLGLQHSNKLRETCETDNMSNTLQPCVQNLIAVSPAVVAAEQAPSLMLRQAMWVPTREDEQAVSTAVAQPLSSHCCLLVISQ